MTPITPERTAIIEYIKAMLGDGMIDIDLDPQHYSTAIDRAFAKYRQRSSNAVEESFGFLTTKDSVNDYVLPQEVMQVRQIFRRSVGSRSGGGAGGTAYEPFNLAYTNAYMLTASPAGGLLTYYAFSAYQKQLGKMFGADINFYFNRVSKTLTLMQRPRGEEEVMLWLYNQKPEFVLLQDVHSKQWLYDYALATCKIMLGEARSLFGNIASPQGGTSLNGSEMKNEGKADIERLELEIEQYKTGDTPLTWIMG